jgi:hypothetical protein
MYYQEQTIHETSPMDLVMHINSLLAEGWVLLRTGFKGNPTNPSEWVATFCKTEHLPGKRLSPWIIVDGYCATRVIEGTDPSVVGNRVAFIEKTPRVCINGFWLGGPKGAGGAGGEDPSKETYGFYPPSRKWADELLTAAGAVLT